MNVNELLDTIEDALEESAGMPLSGGKRIVDVEQKTETGSDQRASHHDDFTGARNIGEIQISGIVHAADNIRKNT